LTEEQIDFHSQCSKKIFGTITPPVLPYTKADIESLALEVVRSQITITGVQPKLSVDLEKEKNGEKCFTISHEQIAKKIVEYSSYPVLDLINYFEVLLFCYLTGNADMHLKNFSLYKGTGEHTLAPACDLLSTKLVIPEDNDELALTLNGKK